MLIDARIIVGIPQNSWQNGSNPTFEEYAPKNDSIYGNESNRMFVKNNRPAINRNVAPKMDKLNFLALKVLPAEIKPKADAYSSKMIIDKTTQKDAVITLTLPRWEGTKYSAHVKKAMNRVVTKAKQEATINRIPAFFNLVPLSALPSQSQGSLSCFIAFCNNTQAPRNR